jgi:hypothetical protein
MTSTVTTRGDDADGGIHIKVVESITSAITEIPPKVQ